MLLQTTREADEEFDINHSMVIWRWKQIEKVKKFNKWVPHELTTNQKNYHLKVLSSLISHNNKPFLNQMVTCNKKLIVYDNRGQSAQ